jgi:hypothetical protein
MFTSRSNLPPPQTHSSIKQRKFNALGEKKLVHLLQSPLEVHVDPAPLRRLNGDGADGAATPREVRDALDRGVPATRLFPFGKTLSSSEVDLAVWDERWKPVVGRHRSPRSRPAALAPPAKRSAMFSDAQLGTAPEPGDRQRASSPMGLDHHVPHPHPLPSPAYATPTLLLRDPDSVAKNRASKAIEARRDAKRKAHEQRLATQVAYRQPKAGEQWRAEAQHLSGAQRSGTAAVLRRWSKPMDPDSDLPLERDDARVTREESGWSLSSAPASARTWPHAAGYVSTTRGAGTACDTGGDLLDQMLGTWPAVAPVTTSSAPELGQTYTKSPLPPLRASSGSPRHYSHRHRLLTQSTCEQIAAEVMGSEYTPVRDWTAISATPGHPALKVRTPPTPSPTPNAAPELWQTMHSELSSHRGGLGRKANVSFRQGELETALRHLCDAIHAQHKVDRAAQELSRATKQAPAPDTAEATAKLHALHALYRLRAGDIDGTLEAAQSAISAVHGERETTTSHACAMAHYRKASALRIKSAQGGEMEPKGRQQLTRATSRLIDPRRQTKWEALHNVAAALSHAPGDARFRALFNRLWREAHTEFGYSTFRETKRSLPKREESESEEEDEEVEVVEKRTLDEAWKFLDLFDLFDHTQTLHEAITRLLGDGGDDYGDGSAKDLDVVLNHLRRTNIAPGDMKGAEKVLKGKTMPLEPETRELLAALRPLDVAEDHKKLMEFLDQEQGYLRIVFRQYCLEGSGDLELLSLNPWRQFCKDIRFIEKRKNGVTKQTIDTIFTRANRNNAAEVLDMSDGGDPRPPGGLDKLEADLLRRVQPGIDTWRRNYELNAVSLRQPEFVAAIVRCAFRKFSPMIPSLHMQVQELFDKHIMPNAGMPVGDEVTELLIQPEVVALFSEDDSTAAAAPLPGARGIATRIRKGFDKLCMENNEDNNDDEEAKTVNIETFQDWIRDRHMLNKDFTAADCRKIFVRVNIDDELNVQAASYDTPDGLTLDEFQECIVRMCVELVGEKMEHDADGAIAVGPFLIRLCALVDAMLPPPKAQGESSVKANGDEIRSAEGCAK